MAFLTKTRNCLIMVAMGAVILSPSLAAAGDEPSHIVKLGYGRLLTDDSSGDLTGPNTPPGVQVSVGELSTLGFSYTWLINDRFGLEFLSGVPYEIDIEAAGTVAGGGDVASTRAGAPTFLLNYYFQPRSAALRPYISAAVNHTFFYDTEATPTLNGLLSGETDVDFDSSTGLGLFAGVDYAVSDKWLLAGTFGFVDASTTATVRTDTVVDVGGTPTNIGIVERSIDLDLNPYYLFLSAGYRF